MSKARRVAAAMVAAACILGPSNLCAENPIDAEAAASRLRALTTEAERAREEGQRLEAETAALSEEVGQVRTQAAAAAAAIEAGAADVAALERQLRVLTQRESAIQARLDARREQIGETLMALQRLARLPPAAMLVHPKSPDELLKAGTLLASAVGAVEQRAEALRQDLLDLNAARTEIEARRRHLGSAVAELRQEHARLDHLVETKSRLQAELASRAWDAAERGRQLAGQAGDAEVLVSRLRHEEQARQALAAAIALHPPPRPSLRPGPGLRPDPQPRAEPEVRPQPEMKGETARRQPSRRSSGRAAGQAAGQGYPADGRIVVRFGDAREGVPASKGITWETAPGARVLAPAAGKVAFAGPFRGYGLLLIVEHHDGYHSLLAGLERIDVGIGQRVRLGDSLGAMGHRSSGNLSLYMELRKDGHPVNPLPWLAAGKRKGSG